MIKKFELDKKDIQTAIEAYMAHVHGVDSCTVTVHGTKEIDDRSGSESITITATVEVKSR